MAITRLVGFYFFGAWDFAGEGYIYDDPARMRVPFDQSRLDDVDQFTFGVARRSSPEEQRAALARGDVVLNGGIYLQYRTQNLTTEGTANPLDGGARRADLFPARLRELHARHLGAVPVGAPAPRGRGRHGHRHHRQHQQRGLR